MCMWKSDTLIVFMNYIRMLLYYNIEPIVVFDGGKLPLKENEECKRYKFIYIVLIFFFFFLIFIYVQNTHGK